MCGILGVVAPDGAGLAAANRMLDALAHRGPDGRGLEALDAGRIILGHARLAIVDLSPSGAQPMALHGADVWITFNGEIYNHRSLRRELEAGGHAFRSTSDTEVLLAGYARWGEGVLDRLDGIFAFGLWDGRRRRLWLARDHLGVKPLYYTRDPRAFAFASEPKALLARPGQTRTPDREAIRDYLSFGYIPGARSAYADIAKLPPGHALIWDEGSVRTYRYWNVADFASEELRDEPAAVRETMRLLDLSTESQLESDVPVGVLVSGGIDSSAVASSVSRSRKSLVGFVVGYDDPIYDERKYARLLSASAGMNLKERVLLSGSAHDLLGAMVGAYDEPFADSSAIPSLALFQFVRDQQFKVVMGGDGGDELFAGYRRYDRLAADEGHSQAPWPRKLIGTRTWSRALRMAVRPGTYRRPAWRSYYERVQVFSFTHQRAVLMPGWQPESEQQLTWPFETYWRSNLDTVKAAQVFDLQTYLPEDILTKVDRASMHYGVEARVPLLARRMVEFQLRVSTDMQRRGRRKHVLKSVLEKRVPGELLDNRKKGFSLPLEMAVGDMLRAWTRRSADSSLVRDGIISSRLPPDLNLDQLWALFVLDQWWSRWGSGTGSGDAWNPS